jgi:hypothetical protein
VTVAPAWLVGVALQANPTHHVLVLPALVLLTLADMWAVSARGEIERWAAELYGSVEKFLVNDGGPFRPPTAHKLVGAH